MRGRRKDRLSEYVGFYDSLLEKLEMWEEGVTFQNGLGKDVWGMVQRYLRQDLMWFHIMVKHGVFDTFRGIEKLLLEQLGNKNVAKWEKTTRRRADAWGHFKWSVPLHVTGRKFLNCVIPYRYEETEEWTPLYLNRYGNKKLHLKEGNNKRNGSFQRIKDEMYVLSRKQQNMMNEIKNVKQEWAMDQKNKWKTKEQELKTKENELNSKVQGMLRENKILKRILQGKRVDRISSNPWRWNSRVKRLSRPPSAVSQLSRSLANF
ncbi:uncharacterized protein TNCV_360771 [Trichonephila clavipes]|nr:uncharacterized protein TNCV_360771 [Trichonephila clavipes]